MTPRVARAGRLVAFAASILGACRDVPAPEGGVFSVSRVVLPSPGLVVGDTMRDSLGAAAPLRVVAFDVNGDTISPAPTAAFILLDTTARLVDDLLIGRHSGAARVRASVAGLQTQIATVLVTLRPDTIAAADSTRHLRPINLQLSDTSYATAELRVVVRNTGAENPTGVDAVVVTYALLDQPVSGNGAGPTVVFVGGSATSARDTTTGGGIAGRAIRLRRLAQPQLPDSAIVTATASYRGASLGTVQFTIVFQTQ